jgi:hypothetical protein
MVTSDGRGSGVGQAEASPFSSSGSPGDGLTELSYVLKCSACDWEWVGRKRRDPTEPDPKEVSRSYAAWQSHSAETGHDSLEMGLREHKTFHFDPTDAPSLEDFVTLAERGGASALSSFERIQAVGERRKAFEKRKRPRSAK